MGIGLRIAAFGIVVGAVGAFSLLWGASRVAAPGPLAEQKTVVLTKGGGVERIATELREAGVIESRSLFLVAAALTDRYRGLKAGEYVFPARVGVDRLLDQLIEGKTVVRRFTVPEGFTSAKVAALLRADPALTGEIAEVPENGTLLPETYNYSLGDERRSILDRMRAAMDKTLADLWRERLPDPSLKTPRDAVVLASIVERETGIPVERPRIARVFLNRLAQGMKLQSDPTVAFAITKGETDLGRPLTRADWKFESPYNTYVVDGLPPGPIANPGREALRAVTKPEKNDFFYFVADGSGGHAFSTSLDEHNRNVARRKSTEKSATGNIPDAAAGR